MIRKWLTVLLSLLLAVMLPVAAMADTQHTLRVIPGDLLASERAVADLLDVFSVTLTEASQSGALTLNLENSPMATIGLSADSTGLYVQSDLVSDDVLYVTWDDGFAFLSGLLQSTLASEGASAEDLQEIQTAMDEAKTSIVTAMQGSAAPAVTASAEELAAQADALLADDPALAELVKKLAERVITTNGMFTSEKHDPASQQSSMTMTSEDLVAFCDTKLMRTIMEQYLVQESGGELSGDRLAHYVETNTGSLKKTFEAYDLKLMTTVYQNEDEELPVSLTIVATFKPEETPVAIKVDYKRLTDESGVDYKAELNILETDEPILEMLFDLNRGYNAVSEGQFSILADGEELTFFYHAENHEADTRVRNLGIYLRSGATAIIPPAASDRPLITFEVTTSPADPALLGDLEAADASNSVNVMKLSSEGMEALIQSASMRSMSAVYGALGKLPTSALSLFMSMME